MSTPPPKKLNLFATTPKGLELLLVDELLSLGATTAAEKLAGVEFTGDITIAYKACLWSRLANRILFSLAKVPAETPEELYQGIQSIQWDKHLDPSGTLAVHFITSQSNITHTLFGAQKVKDAIVDQLRDKHGVRPNVDREQPDVSIYVYLHRNIASINLDLSGESLHKRGYRLSSGEAPLKENLAAAILLRAGWPTIAKAGGSLFDPMCGSGTLLIEAGFIAGDIAPGLARNYFGFLGWKNHQPAIWQSLVTEAEQRRDIGIQSLPTIEGYDNDAAAIKVAFENIERAGFLGKIHVEKRDLSVFAPKQNAKPGLVIVNPPYGERLGEVEELKSLYTSLGERLKQEFKDWKAAVFTGNPDLGKQMGIRSKKYYSLFNGALPCKLFLFDITLDYFFDRSPEAENERRIRAAKRALEGQDMQAVQMFINRVNKNIKHLKRKIETLSGESSPIRIYDADIPEYAFIIDLLSDSAQVEEYPAPKSINPEKVKRRQQEVLSVLPELLNLPPAKIFLR